MLFRTPPRYDEETNNEDNDRGSFTPDFNSRDINPVQKNLKDELNALTPTSTTPEDEDDALSYFQRLAEE